MAVQLTRKEYEQLYGAKPVLTDSDDTFAPTPIRMTRAEYNKLYPTKEYQPPRGFGIVETAKAGVENIKTGLQKTFGAAEAARPQEDIFDEGLVKGTLETLFRGIRAGTESVVGLGRTVGGVAQVGLAPILGPLNRVGEKVGETIGRSLPVSIGSAAEATTKNPLAMQALEDILDLSNLAVPEIGARGIKAIEPVKKAIEIKLQNGELTPPQVKTFMEDRVSSQALKDLTELKSKNAKLRNNPLFDDASMQRIADAQAKTGFLNNATDYDGTIRIKEGGIAQKYREQTIDGSEGVVRQLLKREGAKVNIEEIANAMRVAVDKAFEGADLVNALRGVEKELAGLRKRADEFGDVTLDKVQDMKIATTKYLDYSKPLAVPFKKIKGSVYRQVIEDKSNVTVKVNGKERTIKDINTELQKYYRDIENLEALDGLKVKGGRLGKYFSQTIGALIGSSAGQVAGPLGAAVGGVIGAEAGGALRGAQLARSFGRGGAGELAPNELLQKAKEVGKKEAVVDLRKPDVRVGAPADVPKTKEIRAVEAQITKNVEAQKKAIAEKNFTLVATLKEVYRALVEKLKELIEKASTGTVRGFARLDLGQSKSDGNLKSTQANTKGKTNSSTDANNSTSFEGIPKELQSLAQEAKKYKSAEEFVKAQSPIFRGVSLESASRSGMIPGYSGDSFSRDLNVAKTYGDNVLYKYIPESSILKSNDIPRDTLLDLRKEMKKIVAMDDADMTPVENVVSKIMGMAKEQGKVAADLPSFFRGMMPEREIRVLEHASNTYTKSQLTDLWNKVNRGAQTFEGFDDLSTKLLEKLKGRTTVSRQFIEDLSNSPDLKQAERDLIRRVLGESDSGEVFYRGGGKGKWITQDPEFAKEYGKVSEIRLAKKPNLLNTVSEEADDIAADLDADPLDLWYNPDSELDTLLKKKGYDGFINDEKNIYIADENLIKRPDDSISVPDFAR